MPPSLPDPVRRGPETVALRWEPALAVGIPEVDAQHQELFRRVNALVEGMREHRAQGELQRLLDYLGRYVAEHFENEEHLMREAGYPELAPHLREHADFVADFQSLRGDFLEGGAGPVLQIRLNVWLCGWLRRHVSETDRLLGRFLTASGPPTRA